MKLIDIADELGVSDSLIRKWKHLDKWDEIPAKRPRGAPPGNKNAVGNKGGGAPVGNQNALKHGLYRKYLPDDPEFQELIEAAQELDPLDLLWQSVTVAYAKMMWAQRIMFVRNREDISKELKREKSSSSKEGFSSDEEYEIQFAWDKQAVDIGAFTKISRELRSAINQFLSAAPENDERRLKLELMEAQIEKTHADVEMKKAVASKAANLPLTDSNALNLSGLTDEELIMLESLIEKASSDSKQ